LFRAKVTKWRTSPGFSLFCSHVRQKKERFFFVLFSLNRNFAFQEGEVTHVRQKKKDFSLFCSHLIVTLQPNTDIKVKGE